MRNFPAQPSKKKRSRNATGRASIWTVDAVRVTKLMCFPSCKNLFSKDDSLTFTLHLVRLCLNLLVMDAVRTAIKTDENVIHWTSGYCIQYVLVLFGE